MSDITRNIGLSLGADICWPACYEAILSELDLALPKGDDTVRFHCDRVTVEPFDLQQACKYDVVLDRLTHWFKTSREWIKKAVIMDDLYVLNNPWALQSMEKCTTYAAMMRLGFPVPGTWLLPPKEHPATPDLQPTLSQYARLFDLGALGDEIGYPMFMKPYDGGAWVGVSRIDGRDKLKSAYEDSGQHVMHLQKAVDPYDLFVRCVGIGPQVNVIKYEPSAPLHGRYEVAFHFVDENEWKTLRDYVLTINTFFGWDFNSCEALRGSDGIFRPIDFANACPDSQVTSLHYHFPWLVKSLIRWSVFCAYTKRPMKHRNLDWAPYFAIADEDLPFEDKLARYGALAREKLDYDAFGEFCDTHLSHLDEVAWNFFGTDRAHDIVRAKVSALYPDHEIDRFTEHFYGMVQFWRHTEADARGYATPDTDVPAPVDPS